MQYCGNKAQYIMQFLYLRRQDHFVNMGKKILQTPENREFTMRLCVLGISEAALIKTQQHDCLNMS